MELEKIYPLRLKRVTVSVWFLQACLKEEEVHLKVRNGLPNDARIVRIEFPIYPTAYPALQFIIESESFPELKDGDLIPEVEPPLFEKMDPKLMMRLS